MVTSVDLMNTVAGLADRKAEIERGILGDRGRDHLIAAVELNLHYCHDAAEIDFGDGPLELISSHSRITVSSRPGLPTSLDPASALDTRFSVEGPTPR